MVCFRNYTNEELAMANGDIVEPFKGPKTMKPAQDVVYVLPENIYLKARDRPDVTTPRMLKDKQ
jgi:hypothetical protein